MDRNPALDDSESEELEYQLEHTRTHCILLEQLIMSQLSQASKRRDNQCYQCGIVSPSVSDENDYGRVLCKNCVWLLSHVEEKQRQLHQLYLRLHRLEV